MTDNEFIEYNFKRDNINYDRYVSYLNYNAKIIREEFLQFKLPKYQEYTPAFTKRQIKYYRDLKFHADDAVITKFKEFGFENELLRWLIPLKEFEERFSRINNKTPLTIFRYSSLSLINQYLDSKMLNEIYLATNCVTKFKGRVEMNDLYVVLYTIFRRKCCFENNNKRNKASEPEKKFYSYVDDLTKMTNSKVEAKKFLLAFFSGKIEKYFISPMIHKVLFNNKFSIKELSEQKCLCYLFDLCKLIMKDQDLLTEDEFLDTDIEYYNGDFSKYRAACLSRILGLKNPSVYKNWDLSGA